MRLAPTVIPPPTTVDGVVDTPGDVTVQGRVEGEIRAGETVTVAARATCVASIAARAAAIYGELIGNVVCTDSIQVGPGARVVGDLRAPEVRIDAEATVDGRVDLLPPEPRPSPIRRLPLSARGPAPRRPSAPPADADLDAPSVDAGGASFEETDTERGGTGPTRELPMHPRKIPRAPRPRGRVRVTPKREP